MLYLRRPGGFCIQEWEAAVSATPGIRLVQLSTALADIGDMQVGVRYGGPGAEMRLAYSPKVWVRSGDTHFWIVCFYYTDGCVRFDLHNPDPESPVRLAARRLAELLGAHIEDETGKVQVL